MRAKATEPFFSEAREAYTGEGWVIGINYHYEPGETVGTVHAQCTFKTQDEALAHYHSVNRSSQ